MIELYHYCEDPIATVRPQKEQLLGYKPEGLWLSVGDEWEQWCRTESFRPQTLSTRYRIGLHPTEPVLHLGSESAIQDFTSKFESEFSTINWPLVAEYWKGILIYPYQWGCRLEVVWYYGWDCASGCVWDLSAIKQLELDHDYDLS